MNGRTIRARILLEEALVLGLDLADLIAADVEGASRLPTVSAYIETIAPTFTPPPPPRTGPTGASPSPTSAAAASPTSRWRTSSPWSTRPPLGPNANALGARGGRRGRVVSPPCEPCSAERPTPDSSPSTPPPSSPNPDEPAAAAEPSTTTTPRADQREAALGSTTPCSAPPPGTPMSARRHSTIFGRARACLD